MNHQNAIKHRIGGYDISYLQTADKSTIVVYCAGAQYKFVLNDSLIVLKEVQNSDEIQLDSVVFNAIMTRLRIMFFGSHLHLVK